MEQKEATPVARATVVCLCGSTRFKTAFEEWNRFLTMHGFIVLTVGFFGHHEMEAVSSQELKRKLDNLHLQKIMMSDAILVVDKEAVFTHTDRYIGDSTKNEIDFADVNGRPIVYASDLTQLFSQGPEAVAFAIRDHIGLDYDIPEVNTVTGAASAGDEDFKVSVRVHVESHRFTFAEESKKSMAAWASDVAGDFLKEFQDTVPA